METISKLLTLPEDITISYKLYERISITGKAADRERIKKWLHQNHYQTLHESNEVSSDPCTFVAERERYHE